MPRPHRELLVPLIAKLPAPELDNTLAPALNQTPSLDVEVPLMVRLPAVFDTVLVPRKLVPAPSVEMPDNVMSPDDVRLAPELKFIPLQVALPVQVPVSESAPPPLLTSELEFDMRRPMPDVEFPASAKLPAVSVTAFPPEKLKPPEVGLVDWPDKEIAPEVVMAAADARLKPALEELVPDRLNVPTPLLVSSSVPPACSIPIPDVEPVPFTLTFPEVAVIELPETK